MKKNDFILLLLILTTGFTASSQSIYITKSNHSISSKELNYLSKITFSERKMQLHAISGDTINYPLANVQKIDFKGLSTATLDPIFEQSPMLIYPNPVSHNQVLNIHYGTESQEPIILIAYNATGQVADYQRLFAQDFPVYQYDLTNFKPGFYLITLRQGKSIQTKKLFIY